MVFYRDDNGAIKTIGGGAVVVVSTEADGGGGCLVWSKDRNCARRFLVDASVRSDKSNNYA